MDDNRLLKKQKNEVFKKINLYGLNPSDFNWHEENLEWCGRSSILVYKDTEYCFVFAHSSMNGNYISKFSPGNDQRVEGIVSGSWYDQCNHFGTWLHCLKSEVEAPDLWVDMLKVGEAVAAGIKEDQENKFTKEEIKQIGKRLKDLKRHLLTQYKPDEKVIEHIDKRFEHLEKELHVISRQTFWESLMMNMLFFALQTRIGKAGFDAILGYFSHAFSGAANIIHMLKQ